MKFDFIRSVTCTLRIDLLNGKALIYPVEIKDGDFPMSLLQIGAKDSIGRKRIAFVHFSTSLDRKVIIKANSITRMRLCFAKPAYHYLHEYYATKEAILEEKERGDQQKAQLRVPGPQAAIYHVSKAPYPVHYFDLFPGEGDTIDMKLINLPFPRFPLVGNDGEEIDIPLHQITIMEFDSDLITYLTFKPLYID